MNTSRKRCTKTFRLFYVDVFICRKTMTSGQWVPLKEGGKNGEGKLLKEEEKKKKKQGKKLTNV